MGGEERPRRCVVCICGVKVRLPSSSFIFDDEFGERDEVDKEEDSSGTPNSMSSVFSMFKVEVVEDGKLFGGDGRFLKGIVDGTCLMSIVIAVNYCLLQIMNVCVTGFNIYCSNFLYNDINCYVFFRLLLCIYERLASILAQFKQIKRQ